MDVSPHPAWTWGQRVWEGGRGLMMTGMDGVWVITLPAELHVEWGVCRVRGVDYCTVWLDYSQGLEVPWMVFNGLSNQSTKISRTEEGI